MLNWYYKYVKLGKTVTGAVCTPAIPGLQFSHVRDQLIIPHLCATGVGEVHTLTHERAKNAPGIRPLPADEIAESIVVGDVRHSLCTGIRELPDTPEPARKGLVLRPVTRTELPQAAAIWNDVVAAGDSFPGDEVLSDEQAWALFEAQTVSVAATDGEEVMGVYILHPNNIGRCAHIANASYAVRSDKRGCGIGRALVEDCIERAKAYGYRGLQFNAVVSSNTAAIALYIKLGFRVIGTVPGGYRYQDGSYRDTLIMLKPFTNTP
jgi:ribosomal protein S18 acetylase RimI-like enzyme